MPTQAPQPTPNAEFNTTFPLIWKQQHNEDTYGVEFNGEEYITVMPTPMADFVDSFACEKAAWRWVFHVQQLHACGSWWEIEDKIACGKVLWADLGDIPVNEDEAIDEPFLDFEKGTDIYSIWHWFEETFDVSIGRGDLSA